MTDAVRISVEVRGSEAGIRAAIDKLLNRISQGESIMASIADLTAAVEAVQAAIAVLAASVTAEAEQVTAAIQALKDQLANAGIDPALLDPILASMATIADSVAGAAASVEAIYTPDAPQG